ncbi:uncharacterized protein LOC119603051 [Lucilia sericata]|uniref:uncharacterized protein LOC119603051 n=1 Tax=Lucilia sericata TaxID=13632 RepID=UPI0018A806C8|nr:uncharacterized protein LOC119603051 [Lucilia sericata]
MTEPKKLLVVQINLHHCEAALTELVTFLINSKTDVALIQDQWINNNKLYLSRLLSTRSGDITVINREAKGKRTLTLASVYMPYEVTDPTRHMTAYARRKSAILVMGCGAHAHHCHCKEINKRG